ncbi:MAG: hypothetical protein KDK25_00515 [Leptospiraceae bacterium]|nr:hypothetical protein [Leptospiraceae bacterium]
MLDSILAVFNWPRLLAIAGMLGILGLCFWLPGVLGYRDSLKGWKDLRIWALLLIAIQVFLYWIF